MKRDISQLGEKEYDVVVIGAGMFGVCAAWEAAHRGLSVALVERGDFCGATSAHHFKMVHGGIRYLQHGDIPRIRESSRERSAFLRIAPHLVQPLPILMPTYGHGMKGKEVLGLGMSVYDLITADRNLGIPDHQRKIPGSYFLSSEETLNLFPGIEMENLTGGAVFCDAQMYNPARLALSILHSAVEFGAVAINYVEATGFVQQNGKVTGVRLRDVLDGQPFEVRGKMVLNTAGPWASGLLERTLKIQLNPSPAFSRDAAFVIRRKPEHDHALAAVSKTKDVDVLIDRGGRHLFIAPWLDRDYTLIGVWHIVWGESKDKVYVTEEELSDFIKEVNEAYPPLQVSIDEVTMINTGLTLFGESIPGSKRMSFGKRSLLIDHAKTHSLDGLISLIGVRATIARGMAEKAIGVISQKIGKRVAKSKSQTTPIYGGDMEIFEDYLRNANQKQPYSINEKTMRALVHNHGTQYTRVLNYIAEDAPLSAQIGD
ncbi:MAG: FAD-dependent oxidoreductase, partial [Aliifodinibius sp.]|nr:FAD-dependent oxidoreductase [Fodinibius sp.]NIV10095.1 FAD-dependent oxidoreductase [Fodinibius sp.]NIY23696.1 FAD-dependent oxidoreductase [Fodinibius sp.]